MNERAGESVFGENVDEVLAEKIVRHTERNVEEPPAPQGEAPSPGPQRGMAMKSVAGLLLLAFVFGFLLGRCLRSRR